MFRVTLSTNSVAMAELNPFGLRATHRDLVRMKCIGYTLNIFPLAFIDFEDSRDAEDACKDMVVIFQFSHLLHFMSLLLQYETIHFRTIAKCVARVFAVNLPRTKIVGFINRNGPKYLQNYSGFSFWRLF